MADKFILIPGEGDVGLWIRHTAYPRCEIEVLVLEAESCWLGSLDDIFDFFVFNKKPGNILYQFLIIGYSDADGPDDVTDQQLAAYKLMLNKSWRWFLYRYLIGGEALPKPPEFIALPSNEDSDFTIQEMDGVKYVYHRGFPVFRASLKKIQDAGGIIDELEFLEDYNPDDPMEVARLMRRLGDFLATHKNLNDE